MDQFVIEFGTGLETLFQNPSLQKGKIKPHLQELERNHQLNYGVSLPQISFQKNEILTKNEYRLVIMGEMAGQGSIIPGAMMAIPPKHNKVTLPGTELRAPLLDTPVTWIDKKKTRKAEAKGFSLVSPLNVLMQHISATLVSRLDILFTKEAFIGYIGQLSQKCQIYVSDIVPKQLTFGTLLSVFQMLLAEKVSVRDSGLILKAISEASCSTNDAEIITEHVRGCLARQITASHLSGKGYLPLISLSEEWEKEFRKSSVINGSDSLDAPVQHAFQDSLGEVLIRSSAAGEKNPIILTRASSRRAVKTLMHQFAEDIPVLSQNEIHTDIELKTIGWIS